MRWRRVSFAWLAVPAAALIAVLPLILHGYSCGHDFDFHLVSWFEAAAQFRAGTLHPSWAFSPAWNAGEPRFVFYPPLSWTLGGLLGMVLPWAVVPAVYTWLALAAAGAGMYALARQFTGEQPALLATAVYVANPYLLFTAYERTAYAELLAAAWIPLLLAGVLRERVTVLRVALPVGLLWLTNAPAAVMGCYTVALLALVRVVWALWRPSQPDKSTVSGSKVMGAQNDTVRVVAGVALGVGSAAFYVVPAAYERRWVQIAMATVPGMNIKDNFLFQKIGDGPHDEVLHTASAIALTMLAAAAVVISAVFMRARMNTLDRTRVAASLAVLAAVIAFMLTPLSARVWYLAPEMSFLQFPWRLVAVLAAVVCAGIGIALQGRSVKPLLLGLGLLATVIAMSLPAAAHFRQGCDEEDTVAARLAVFNAKSGSEPTDEYTPMDADNDPLKQADPPFWLVQDGTEEAPPDSRKAAPLPTHFTVQVSRPEALVLNLRAYPVWLVKVNGAVTVRIPRADGLIAFPIKAGVSTVDVAFVPTLDQRIGTVISLVSICTVAGLAAATRRRQTRSRIIGG